MALSMDDLAIYTTGMAGAPRCCGQFCQRGRLLPLQFVGVDDAEVREAAQFWLAAEAEKAARPPRAPGRRKAAQVAGSAP